MKKRLPRIRSGFLRIGVGLPVLVAMLAYAAGRLPLPFTEGFERQLYDLRLRLTMTGTRDARIAIVDIDEKSLAKVGSWPWRRERMAALVNTLFEHDQAAAGIRFQELDCVHVKGKRLAVKNFRPLPSPLPLPLPLPWQPAEPGAQAAASLDDAAWMDMLQYYRAGDADAAQAALARLAPSPSDHRLAALYAERIVLLRQLPPGAAWDGMTRFDSK